MATFSLTRHNLGYARAGRARRQPSCYTLPMHAPSNSILVTIGGSERAFVHEGIDVYRRGAWITRRQAVASFRKIVAAGAKRRSP
jgi:hypothetical protein